MVVYCSNWCPEFEGTHFRPHAAICLETCNFTDTTNMCEKEGWPNNNGVLSMGEQYNHTTVHKFVKLAEIEQNEVFGK